MPAISVPMATIQESAAKRRRRVADDFWPWVARHSLVTSTSASGLSSDMFRSPPAHRAQGGPTRGTCKKDNRPGIQLFGDRLLRWKAAPADGRALAHAKR